MSRDEAGHTLQDAADGTFMIRRNNDQYALSIAFGGSVKHIRVKKEEGACVCNAHCVCVCVCVCS